jgi:hypothetical protein
MPLRHPFKEFSMRILLAALLLSGGAATAQTVAAPAPAASPIAASAIRTGTILRDSGGARVGQIDRVITAADGSVAAVQVIAGERFVRVPAETLTATDKGVATSLTRGDIRKLR